MSRFSIILEILLKSWLNTELCTINYIEGGKFIAFLFSDIGSCSTIFICISSRISLPLDYLHLNITFIVMIYLRSLDFIILGDWVNRISLTLFILLKHPTTLLPIIPVISAELGLRTDFKGPQNIIIMFLKQAHFQ